SRLAISAGNGTHEAQGIAVAVLDSFGGHLKEGFRAVRAGGALEGGEDRRHSLDGKMPRAVWTTGGGVLESTLFGCRVGACLCWTDSDCCGHDQRHACLPGVADLLAQL